MAITESVGYEGTVDYDTYSQTVTQAGRYTTASYADWRPVVAVGGYTVRINAGVGAGYGIRDTSTDTNLVHDSVSSGVRYDLIVCHRDWSAGTSEFQIIKGGSLEALPARDVSPGVADDQPLALVRITAGSADPVIVADLRCWAGDGGLVAVHERALDYLGELPGTRVTIAGDTYTRVLTAAGAVYWDVNRSADNSLGPRPSVIIGRGSSLAYGATGEWLVGIETPLTNYMYNPASVGLTGVGGGTQENPSRISVGQAGLYSYGFRIAVRAPAAFRANANVGVFGAGAIDPSSQVDVTSMDYPGGNIVRYLSGGDTRWIRAGTGLGLRLDVNAGIEVVNWRIWATWLGN